MQPNSGFVIEKLSDTRAIIFGGVLNVNSPSNLIYIIEVMKEKDHIRVVSLLLER